LPRARARPVGHRHRVRRRGRRAQEGGRADAGGAGMSAAVDFEAFHRHDVPGLLAAGNGAAAAGDLGDGRSLAITLPGGPAFTYRAVGRDMEVVAGDDADVVVELAPDAFADLASEAWSLFGLLYGDRVAMRRGSFEEVTRWEAPLQAVWFGRPIYGPDAVAALVARDGAPTDLSLPIPLYDHRHRQAYI